MTRANPETHLKSGYENPSKRQQTHDNHVYVIQPDGRDFRQYGLFLLAALAPFLYTEWQESGT